jgi:hypothetical protein
MKLCPIRLQQSVSFDRATLFTFGILTVRRGEKEVS